MNLKEIIMKQLILIDMRRELNNGGLRLNGKFPILAKYLQDNR